MLTTLETVVINQYLNYSLEYLVTAIVNRKIYVTILHYAVILTMTTGWAKKTAHQACGHQILTDFHNSFTRSTQSN